MSSDANTPKLTPSMQALPANRRRQMRHAALLMLLPVLVYAAVRPLVSSDALGLAIAGGVPTLYSLALALVRRQADPVALVSAVGFGVACAVSLLSGGSSLPMKLQEAPITFGVGSVMLVAVLIRRPFPVGRVLRIPSASKRIDSSLGAVIGVFLMLHALVHVALAVALSTSAYLVTSRILDTGTLVAGLVGLNVYVRRVRASLPE
jgi:hypothetical protein